MIARLRGILAGIGDDHAIVDVAGVGYLVTIAPATLERLPRVGEAVELHTELQLREDGMTLYGFPDPADRTWFRLLQTVQGVGARVALSLLGTLRPHELANAIAAGDKAMLARATGVGGGWPPGSQPNSRTAWGRCRSPAVARRPAQPLRAPPAMRSPPCFTWATAVLRPTRRWPGSRRGWVRRWPSTPWSARA